MNEESRALRASIEFLEHQRDEWKARAEKAEKRTKITEFFKDPGTGECCFRDADGREMFMSEYQAVGVSDALSYRERMLEWKARAEKAESHASAQAKVLAKALVDSSAKEERTIAQVVAWLKARAECLEEDIEELRGSVTSSDMTKRSLLSAMRSECVFCAAAIERREWKEG